MKDIEIIDDHFPIETRDIFVRRPIKSRYWRFHDNLSMIIP